MRKSSHVIAIGLAGVSVILCIGRAAIGGTFTEDALISSTDTRYDGTDIVVTNCTLTVDGAHSFQSVTLLSGGKLTHTYAPDGYLRDLLPVVDEPHTMAPTNTLLDRTNVVPGSVQVKDETGANQYIQGSDFQVAFWGGQAEVSLVQGSAIAPGARLLISYTVDLGATPSGLFVSTTGAFVIEAGGGIDSTGRGFGPGRGPGQGSSRSTNDPVSYVAGAGGGHGGNGGLSSSLAAGGNYYGSVMEAGTKGSSGGPGSGPGGVGGGLVSLNIEGELRVDGGIVCSGGDATNARAGGGSGGSIRVVAQGIRGSGSIVADGGAGEPRQGGGGGGGRILLVTGTNQFEGTLSARGGPGWLAGGAGTIAMTRMGSAGGRVFVDNGDVEGTNTFLSLAVDQEVTIGGRAKALVMNSTVLRSISVGANSTLIPPESLLMVMGNLRVDAGGRIDASGRGYAANSGPGRGTYYSYPIGTGGGGGYGGNGGGPSDLAGRFLGGTSYGSAMQPIDRGSGGGFPGPPYAGGAGGGIVRLDVKGELKLDGVIEADGQAGADIVIGQSVAQLGGGGSGGSVWLSAQRFTGSGRISANGGEGAVPSGGGAGGRIAVHAVTNDFTGVLRACGGTGGDAGGAGTIYITGAPARLIVDNGGIVGTNTPLTGLQLGSVALRVTGGAAVYYPVSFVTLDSLLVGSNSWFRPGSSPTPCFLEVLHSAAIEQGGGISVDGMGYRRGEGPGGGRWQNYFGGGGGYGGYGGNSVTNAGGGNAYGSMLNPREPGSGGGYVASEPAQTANAGGGALLLTVREDLVLEGALSASGVSAATNRNGGGAGGSLNVNVGTISGAGLMRANGGAGMGGGGGGGGGRILLFSRTNQFAGNFEAQGGVGATTGGAGTVCLQEYQGRSITQVIVDNGGRMGTNALLTAPGNVMDLTIRNGGAASFGMYGIFLPLRTLRIGSDCSLMAGPMPSGGYPYRITVGADATIERGGRLTTLASHVFAGYGSGRYSPYGGAGGSHAGYGSDPLGAANLTGSLYGSVTAPSMPGSAGGRPSTDVVGGAGGGALQLIVERTLSLEGSIYADGTAAVGANCGGGSGGSILVEVGTITGSGSISADGGDGEPPNGGGGGGGRVALLYRTNAFGGFLSARGGRGPLYGGAGTVYVKKVYEPIGRVLVDNGGKVGGLTGLLGGTPSYHLEVSGGAVVFPFITTGSLPAIQSLRVGPMAAISQGAGQPFLELTIMGDATIEREGAVVADGKGYSGANAGPGYGQAGGPGGSGGGGYGGAGGASAGGVGGGITYGDPEAPFEPGSRGGMSEPVAGSSEGGGIIRLKAGGVLKIDGRVSANGNEGWWDGSGGGAGGSVWLSARELRGSGAIAAKGGMGEPFNGGGGGGGRIALYYVSNSFPEGAGYLVADGGEGANRGENGSIHLSTNLPAPKVISYSVPVATEPATFVDVLYSVAMDAESLPGTEVLLRTPNETLRPALSVVGADARTVRLSFAAQNTPGDYQFTIGPELTDWMGVPTSIAYTGSFSLQAPLIIGRVTDPNGSAVPGVLVQPGGGLNAVTNDAEGVFSLPVLPGWSGTVVPSLPGKAFLPPQIEYVNVGANQPNQRFIAAEPEQVRVNASVLSTNLNVSWFAISNVTYHVIYSTDLVNWLTIGEPLQGDGTEHQLPLPLEQFPSVFITVKPVY